MASQEMEQLVRREYKEGFVTDIESDTVPPGLDESTIAFISNKKGEPEWMLEWRLKAYHQWLKMTPPSWAHLDYPPIDYQAISYYSAPKRDEDRPQSPTTTRRPSRRTTGPRASTRSTPSCSRPTRSWASRCTSGRPWRAWRWTRSSTPSR